MAIKSYKTAKLVHNRNVRANRTCLYYIVDGDQIVGKLTLDMDFAIVEDKPMGTHGKIKDPQPAQLIERLKLDVPRGKHETNRYVKFDKKKK